MAAERPDSDFFENDGYINRSYLGSGTASSNKFLRGDHVWETIPSGTAAGSYNILAAGSQTADSTGTVLFNNSNGLTFGMSNSSVITASHNGLTSQSNQAFSAAGGSSAFQTLSFNNANGISFSNSGGAIEASHNALTTAMASNRGSDFVQATAAFAGTSASGTIASNGISVSIGPYLTTAALSNHSHGVSFTSGSTVFQTLSFTNSNGISFNSGTQGIFASHNALTTARASTDAIGLNTALTAGPLAWTVNSSGLSLNAGSAAGTSSGFAGANISGSITHNTAGINLSLSVAAPGGGAVVSNAIQDVGTATGSGTNTSRFAADDHVHRGVIGIVGVGTASTFYGSVHLSAGNNLTISTAGNSTAGSIAFHVAAPGGAATKSYHRFPHMPINTNTVSFGQSTSFVAPFILSSPLSIGLIRMVYSGSVAASSTQATTGNTSLSMSGVTSHNIVFYSRGVGGNSMSLQYVTSTQQVDQQLATFSIAANSSQHSVSNRFTLGSQSFTKDYSSSVTRQDFHTSNLTDLTGPKYIDLPMAVSLDAGQYWIAYGRSTTNATQANSISVATRMLVSHNTQVAVSFNTLALGMLGGNTNSSVGWWQAHGSLTTAGGGTTSSIPMANVSTLASNNALYIQMMRVA